jgi:glycosyltransferase involved in cell wall biosynthesis
MRIAKENITFIEWQNRSQLRKFYSECKALIFPGEEDFGIVPVEAQACGRPVIAFAKGGAIESVKGAYPDRKITSFPTGIFFTSQTEEALVEAVKRFDSIEFDPQKIRENALRFDRKLFKERIGQFIQKAYREHQESLR